MCSSISSRGQNLITARLEDELVKAIHNRDPVHGFTHSFYRYPACFSPSFAKAIIESFSSPGELVLDPFMGGGTTLVEAIASGRDCIGTDISSLATFISKVKTTLLTKSDLSSIEHWSLSLPQRLNLRSQVDIPFSSAPNNLTKYLPWQIRKCILQILALIPELNGKRKEAFAKCVLLKTSQWAIDGKKDFPPVSDFRYKFFSNLESMSLAMLSLKDHVETISKQLNLKRAPKCQCITRSAIGLEEDVRLKRVAIKPKLILTSPPYPGTHVLYHRWQVFKGRETPAPFLIIQTDDGMGESQYTLGSRKQESLDKYFENLQSSFISLRNIIDDDGYLVQLVSFSDSDKQLIRFLECLNEAGFIECIPKPNKGNPSRVWRHVPNRKWYTNLYNSNSSRREVLLIHRPI